MNLIRCTKCGKEFDAENNVCPECGAIITPDEVNSQTESNSDSECNGENSESVGADDAPICDACNLTEGDASILEAENATDSNKSEKKKRITRTVVINIMCVIITVSCLGYSIYTKQKCDKWSKAYTSISAQLSESREDKMELEAKISQLESENDELVNGAQKQLSDIKNAYEKGEWQKVIDLAAKLHEKYNGSSEDNEAQQLAKTSQENIDKKKAEEEAEKAKGYETGITYDQLARTPDDYKGKKVKFYGKVIQVMEGDGEVTIRLAVDDNYDTILYGQYDSNTVSSRVLEDDYITVYGTSVGTISYKSTIGGQITIPGVYIEKIDQ